MKRDYINKVVEEIFEDGLSELEIKTRVYKRLNEELEGEDRVYLKMLELEIQNLEDDGMEFTDRLVRDMNRLDEEKRYESNQDDYDEENLGCQSGDDDGRELNFG
tara:strand:- start:473 stop:787 length:315 start_codon:yes stop_codon:yes gene_type:complete